MRNYVITIARGFGSGGKEIAGKVAAELGIPCYEKQILDMASDKSGINEELFAEVDEKLRGKKIRNYLTKISLPEIVTPQDKNFTSDINLFNIQAEIIRNLAETESCVIVGKCADYILRERKNVISVYVDAPRSSCIKSIVRKLRVDEETAENLIVKTDKYRSDYYKFYTGGLDWTNMNHYDFVLNSYRLGREECVNLIVDTVKRRFL